MAAAAEPVAETVLEATPGDSTSEGGRLPAKHWPLIRVDP